jgi:branched-chain amino acid aminotransferase
MFDNTYFKNAKKYWYNGKFYDWSDPTLHPMSHALHYGSSVFEGIRSYLTPQGPAIFRLPEHLDRFLLSARVAKMEIPYSREEIAQAIKLTLLENKLQSGYIRPLLFYSYGNLGLVPLSSPEELLIAVWELNVFSADKKDKGISVYIVPWRRIHHRQLDMRAKLGGLYILSAINALEARERGYDEALFLNLEGNVAEGPGANLFIVKNGRLKTNDLSESILEGITRTTLLEMAGNMGLRTKVGPITRKELFEADEAFFSGTAVEITPIIQIADGSQKDKEAKKYEIGSGQVGAVTRRLAEDYHAACCGLLPRYHKWLTYVEEQKAKPAPAHPGR